MTDQKKTATCFVSYSWDSDAHRRWVLNMATVLTGNGVLVRLDEWEVLLGDDLTKFMESGIRESDYVLIVCTPAYAVKADARCGGAGYETSVITGELFQLCPRRNKYVPILREGTPATALPSYLKNALFADLRKDSDFQSKIEELLRHIYRRPRNPRPPRLGPPPFVTGQQASDKVPPRKVARQSRPSEELDRRIADLQRQLQELHGAHVPTYISGGRFINFDIDEAIGRLTAQLAELQGERKRTHSDLSPTPGTAECVDLNPLSLKRTAEMKALHEDRFCYRCGNYTMYGSRCKTCGAYRD